jgi:hypothetical protein
MGKQQQRIENSSKSYVLNGLGTIQSLKRRNSRTVQHKILNLSLTLLERIIGNQEQLVIRSIEC